MEGGLVDLSLFTTSPADDEHFALSDEDVCASALGLASRSVHPASTMKPLPPIPHRRLGALTPDSRSNVCNPARTVLERVKRMRVDPSPSLDYPIGSPSTQQRPQQTLQQRRNGSITPSLTIPTPSHLSSSISPASAAAVTTPRPAAPMIWLADEEMWLVADSIDAADSDMYGFYAPAPHTDPGPHGFYAPTAFDDVPPAYSASPTSDPSPSDFSPVRSQFSALLEAQGSAEASRPATSTTGRPLISDPQNLSPMFQEAISGVGFGIPYEGAGPGWSKNAGRRDSWHSDSGVSPLTASTESPAKAAKSIQRHASARH